MATVSINIKVDAYKGDCDDLIEMATLARTVEIEDDEADAIASDVVWAAFNALNAVVHDEIDKSLKRHLDKRTETAEEVVAENATTEPYANCTITEPVKATRSGIGIK